MFGEHLETKAQAISLFLSGLSGNVFAWKMRLLLGTYCDSLMVISKLCVSLCIYILHKWLLDSFSLTSCCSALSQVCTEMVMPMCTDGVHDMFEPQKWDFEALSDECFKLWGVRPRPSWILSMYGGKNISSHSNIIFRWALFELSSGSHLSAAFQLNKSDSVQCKFLPLGFLLIKWPKSRFLMLVNLSCF